MKPTVLNRREAMTPVATLLPTGAPATEAGATFTGNADSAAPFSRNGVQAAAGPSTQQ